MWPQLLRCGNCWQAHTPSMYFTLQCGRNFCVAEICLASLICMSILRRFNVAATFALRKSEMVRHWSVTLTVASMWPQLLRCGNPYPLFFYRNKTRLQCGRNFCVAEIRFHRSGNGSPYQASMWPQLLRCGNMLLLEDTRSCDHRFNVAATFALRKFTESNGSGKYAYALQCGRNFCVAEISFSDLIVGRTVCFNVAATFALRKFLNHPH